MARGHTDYLNDWNPKDQEGDSRKNASGADTDITPYDGGIAARWPMPETEEWGIGPDGNSGGFGHSDTCKDVGQKGSTWGASASDLERGYELPGNGGAKTPGVASYEQAIPSNNEWDRTEPYAKEHSATTGYHDGEGQPESTSNPGGESLGSSKLPY